MLARVNRIRKISLLLRHSDVKEMGERTVTDLGSWSRSRVLSIEQGGDEDFQKVFENREKLADYEPGN